MNVPGFAAQAAIMTLLRGSHIGITPDVRAAVQVRLLLVLEGYTPKNEHHALEASLKPSPRLCSAVN